MAKSKRSARSTKRTPKKRVGGVLNVHLVTPRIFAINRIRRVTTGHRSLSFAMQHQKQTQWCWAAVGTSVAHYYNATSPWTQCSLVNAEFGRTDCCTNPSSGPCNRPHRPLEHVLTRVGHLANRTAGATSFAKSCGEIDAGRPLAAHIAWSGGGGHFVILSGYTSNSRRRFVQVEDPNDGTSVCDYNSFRTAYEGFGRWTISYKTRP